MTASDVFAALLVIGLLLLAGRAARSHVAVFRRIFLPSSILAGAIGLAVAPHLPEQTVEVWRELPELLISVVFAGLFLGKRIPGPRTIWRMAGPQAAFGQTVAWGQYVVGLLLVLVVLGPLLGTDPLAGTLIEIGFQGGHGTAGGLGGTFEAVGFEEGRDLALGLATVGVVTSVLVGTAIVNWGVRTGRISPDEAGGDRSDEAPRRPATATDPLSLHIGLVAVAIGVGWLLLRALVALEEATWGANGTEVLTHVPLFPLAMIGGVVVQVLADRLGGGHLVERELVERLSGTALDLVVVAAIATVSLEVLGGNAVAFAALALAGIAWNVVAFLLLAPRIMPDHWFERGIADLGQSLGMTVAGLLLLRMSDPGNRSGALESFGSKQLLFEPVVGGGLFTAASLPLVAGIGPWPVLVLCAVLTAAWLAVGLLVFGRQREPSHPPARAAAP